MFDSVSGSPSAPCPPLVHLPDTPANPGQIAPRPIAACAFRERSDLAVPRCCYRAQSIQRARCGVWGVGGALRMTQHLDRREFIQLAGLTTAGIAGVVFSSGL